jgi:hypothetical protein
MNNISRTITKRMIIYISLLLAISCSTTSKQTNNYKFTLQVEHILNGKVNILSPLTKSSHFLVTKDYLFEFFTNNKVYIKKNLEIGISPNKKNTTFDTTYVTQEDTTAVFIKNLKNNTQYYVKAFKETAPLLLGKDTLVSFNRYDYNGNSIEELVENAKDKIMKDTLLKNTHYKYYIQKSIPFSGDSIKDKHIDMVVLFFEEPLQVITPFNVEFKKINSFKLCLAGYIIHSKQNNEIISFYIDDIKPMSPNETKIIQSLIYKDPSIKNN